MKRPIIPLLTAAVLALIAGVLVFWYANSAENRALEEQQAVTVLIAAGQIPEGITLEAAAEAGLVEQAQVSDRLSPEGALAAVDPSNAKLIASAGIPAGQVLLAEAFTTEAVAPTGVLVPEGLLAVTVVLGDPQKVGTFLRPGSFIAVFDTASTTSPERPEADPVVRTRALLDRVEVLAIGPVTSAEASGIGPEDWSNSLVTLAVDQEQAEKLIHGAQTGALYLALLGDDTTLRPSEGVTNVNVFE